MKIIIKQVGLYERTRYPGDKLQTREHLRQNEGRGGREAPTRGKDKIARKRKRKVRARVIGETGATGTR